MNRYELHRRQARIVWVLVVMLALPPGFMPAALAVSNLRINTLSRDTKLETFRNPMFSSASDNRFFFNHAPTNLLGGGGDDFSAPDQRGYGSIAEPKTHWLSYKGRLEWAERDLMLKGVGLPLIFQRMYRGSVSSYNGPLGHEWEFNWNKRIQYDPQIHGTRAWFLDMGRRESYDLMSGAYVSPSGRYDVLTRTATPEYWRTDNTGVKEVYEQEANPNGDWFRLKSITDLNSNSLSFLYDANSRLTKVTDTLSQDTTLSFDSNDRITKITDPFSREWVYAYDGGGHLTTARTPTVDEAGSDDDYTSGKTTTYLYDSNGNLTELKRPADSSTGTWKWYYDLSSGKITQSTHNGHDTILDYDDTARCVDVDTPEGMTTCFMYSGADDRNVVTKRKVETGPGTSIDTLFYYDSNTNVTKVEFPRGNRIEYTYDGSGNVVTVKFKKDSGDSSPPTWVYTWASNARLSTLRDPRGYTWDYDYDANGNLTHKSAPAVTMPTNIASADGNGNGTYDGTIGESWAYNSVGLVTTYTDAVGTVMKTSYTTVNAKAAYPDQVTADQGTSKLNLITDYDYDSRANVSAVTDPNGNTTTYTVNALNQTILAVEPLSVTKKYHFDANDRLSKTEQSNDTNVGDSWFIMNCDYDQADNMTRLIEDVESGTRLTTTYDHDQDERLTLMTSPLGAEHTLVYDNRGLQVTTIRGDGSPGDARRTITDFDDNGNRLTVKDTLANATLQLFDLYDRVTKVIEPAGNYTTRDYDLNGNVTKVSRYNVGNSKLAETSYCFDEANRLYETDELAKKADLSTNIGDGTKSTIVWRDESGRTLEQTGDICGCSSWVHVYDALGRRITSKDPMGNADNTRNLVVSSVDKNGNVTKTVMKDRSQDTGIEADKDIETDFVFDARNRLITRTEKQGSDSNTLYFYGLRDQLTKVTSPIGDEVRTEYNEMLWKTKDILENGATDPTTEYTYDSDGEVVTYRAKNSTTGDQDTVYTYDLLGEVLTTTWPPNSVTAQKTICTYDKAGGKISSIDPNGTVVVCAYDSNHRLTAKTNTLASNIVGATSLAFGYDGLNRMTSASTDENGAYTSALTWTFNTLGKPESEKQVWNGYNSGNGRTVSYTWDERGQKLSCTYPTSGAVIAYMRDALDRADTISRDSTQVVDYTFSGRRVLKKTFPGSHALYTYDAYGRLSDVHHKDTSSGYTLARFTYGWNGSSEVTYEDKLYYDDTQNTRITTDGSDKGDQYGYDGAGRLVSVLRGVPSNKMAVAMATNISNNDFTNKVIYTYDQTGNRMTRDVDGTPRTYAYNKANEMTTEAGNTLTYNKNGAFVGGSNTYKYTFTDQLGKYETTPIVYHYDAFGRFIEREYPTVSSERFYYDGQEIIEQNHWQNSTETAKMLLVYGERIDELLEYLDVDANPDKDYYAHADLLGSVNVLASETGAIKESYRYREFGETTVVDSGFAKLTIVGSLIGNDTQYTGRRQDLGAVSSYGNNWYGYRARVYRTDAGSFLQHDPTTYFDGANLYAYARGMPTVASDPTGRSCRYAAYVIESGEPTCNIIIYPDGKEFETPGICGYGGGDIHLDTGTPGQPDEPGPECKVVPTNGGTPESLSAHQLSSNPGGHFGGTGNPPTGGDNLPPASSIPYGMPGLWENATETVSVTWTGNGTSKTATVTFRCECDSGGIGGGSGGGGGGSSGGGGPPGGITGPSPPQSSKVPKTYTPIFHLPPPAPPAPPPPVVTGKHPKPPPHTGDYPD